MDGFEEELAPYDTSPGTIRFPAAEPLPATLGRQLVRARIAENAAAAKPSRRARR